MVKRNLSKNKYTKEQYVWVLLRLGMGWIFLWPFFDKLFGLGFNTSPEKAWILGNSPTFGFLTFATKGPFASFYKSLAGSTIVDWLFMVGLLLIGLSLILGIGMKIAGYSGALMMILMWSAVLPPEYDFFLDYHIIYAIILVGLTMVKSGCWFGLGGWWSKTMIVKKFPFLE